MQPIIPSLLLSAMAATPPATPAAPPEAPVTTYQTGKSERALEDCLTRALSSRGDVTAIAAEGVTTLMFRDTTGRPMLIDLAPRSLKVTTSFASGTRHLVEHCL
jgi:hypothetical protein